MKLSRKLKGISSHYLMIFKNKKLDRADKIAAWRLCMGCGACAYACPNQAISLVNIDDVGIRPQVDGNICKQCSECIKVCPGIGLEHESFSEDAIEELKQAWGPVLQLWEGYATDQKIRYAGSSGGIATALALYALENGIAGGVLHVGVDRDNPIKNVPVYSKTKEQLLACTGSRYSPASLCQAFGMIKKENCKSIFIGKPCDVAALAKARKLDAELDEKVAFMISIFCAGTPTTKGTLAVLEQMGISNISELKSFQYRGNGWPGSTAAVKKNGEICKMEYAQSWGDILSKHAQLRCRLCPDSTGEFADISCGDPWYRKIEQSDQGQSLVLVRSNKGNEIIQNALKSEHISVRPAESCVLSNSQVSVLKRKQQLWGRLRAMRFMWIPVPCFKGFSLFSNWKDSSVNEKVRSIVGTFKRMILRKWHRPFAGSQE